MMVTNYYNKATFTILLTRLKVSFVNDLRDKAVNISCVNDLRDKAVNISCVNDLRDKSVKGIICKCSA